MGLPCQLPGVGGKPSRTRCAARADWIRLIVTCWFFSATGVLPFYNDAVALGAAIRDNPVVVAADSNPTQQGRIVLKC